MNNPIKFGTDGWRAVIADEFTFANVRFCGQGAADYLKQKGLAGRRVYIGYDRRFASEDFAAAAAEVVAGNGIHVLLSPKAIPTPFVSFGVITQKTGAVSRLRPAITPPDGTVSNSARKRARRFHPRFRSMLKNTSTARSTGRK